MNNAKRFSNLAIYMCIFLNLKAKTYVFYIKVIIIYFLISYLFAIAIWYFLFLFFSLELYTSYISNTYGFL